MVLVDRLRRPGDSGTSLVWAGSFHKDPGPVVFLEAIRDLFFSRVNLLV